MRGVRALGSGDSWRSIVGIYIYTDRSYELINIRHHSQKSSITDLFIVASATVF